jgi:hypothetical protein
MVSVAGDEAKSNSHFSLKSSEDFLSAFPAYERQYGVSLIERDSCGQITGLTIPGGMDLDAILLDLDKLKSVKTVKFRYPFSENCLLAILGKVVEFNPEELRFHCLNKISENAFRVISKMHHLRRLVVVGGEIDPVGLLMLEECGSLTDISIYACREVGEFHFQAIGKISSLKNFELRIWKIDLNLIFPLLSSQSLDEISLYGNIEYNEKELSVRYLHLEK